MPNGTTFAREWEAGIHDGLVTTPALSAGIDKPDIRLCIHAERTLQKRAERVEARKRAIDHATTPVGETSAQDAADILTSLFETIFVDALGVVWAITMSPRLVFRYVLKPAAVQDKAKKPGWILDSKIIRSLSS